MNKLYPKIAILIGACLTAFYSVAFAQEEGASSVPDLQPYVAPDDFYPIFPWDHLGYLRNKGHSLPETVESIKACGCTTSAFVDSPEELEIVKRAGLPCIYDFELDIFSDEGLTEEEIAKECAKIDAKVKEGVQATKNEPLVIGYYIVDEPNAHNNRAIAAAFAAVKKYAPGKMAYVNLYPCYAGKFGDDVDAAFGTRTYKEYLERYVQETKPFILSYDDYMIDCSEDMRNPVRLTGYFTDLFDVREVALKYGLPFWAIGASLSLMPESSPPNLARFALQAYVPLAAGAEGITWFLFYSTDWTNGPLDKSGRKTLSWVYMRDINEQIAILGPYLKKYRSTALGISPLFTEEEAPHWQGLNLPEIPKSVLKDLRCRFSKNASQELAETDENDPIAEKLAADAYREEPKVMVGEFARKEGEGLAAVAVNLSVSASIKAFFEKPEGYSTLKVVSQVDGSEETIDDETLEQGFWILPGHGLLFVLEK